MRKVFWAFAILIVVALVYWLLFRPVPVDEGPKQEAIKVSKHSPAFNSSIDSLMTVYFNVKAAFVESDSITAKAGVEKLIGMVDSLNLDELKKDSALILMTAKIKLDDLKASAQSLVKQPNLFEMRHDFSDASDNIYAFLRTIHYEGKTLYWQNCPMAFGEEKGANWISNTEEIVNPYLGKNHPEYHATMLHCGSVQDSIKAN